jgi:hypothetical protein
MTLYEPFNGEELSAKTKKKWNRFGLVVLIFLFMIFSYLAGYFICWHQQPFEIKYTYDCSRSLQKNFKALEIKHGRENSRVLLSDRLGFYYIDEKGRRNSFK